MRSFDPSRLLPAFLGIVVLAGPALAQQGQSKQAQALLRQAQEAMQKEDYQGAERLYRAAAAADPQSPEASCGLGQVFLALQQYEDAVRSLENCKRDVLANLQKAHAAQAKQWSQIENEINELEDSIQAIQSGYVKGAGPDRVLRLEERIRQLREMQSRESVRVEVPPRISLALGTAYLNAGFPEKAEWEFVDVLRVEPDSGEAHNNLAAAYLALGRFEEAAEHVRLAEEAGVRVNPQMKADISAKYSPGAKSASRKEPTGPSGGTDKPIRLEPRVRTCAVDGRFVHVQATVTPSWGIHDPKLSFRTGEDGGWYSTFMLPAGQNDFAALLPKLKSAKGFTYFIEVKTYDDEVTRSPDYKVARARDEAACPEAAEDLEEAGSVLIIDTPKEVADAPPVPDGFSIRGTTADVGALEVGQNKALIYGGIGLAGAVAAGVAVASQAGGAYAGPQPFSEGPGISLEATDPPSGSTLSLSHGQITVQLGVYSIEDLPGAQVDAELVQANGRTCIALSTHEDLPPSRTVSVVLSGPTTPAFGSCDMRFPIDAIRVTVLSAGGLPRIQTGVPPLGNFRVDFELVE